MEEGKILKSVFKGLMGAVLLALILLLILSLIMTKFDLTEKVYSIVYVVITALSLVIGSVFAAKCNGRKGWLTGFLVGLMFFVCIHILGAIATGNISFDMAEMYKLGASITIGTIAGILGVNL
ncbi:TIGR04086 family membrane protein [Clostridium paraputrificum]|uniref:TIGR04086 family membrane protein n=1 Tax=Clostridium TaxID=1485 RepID=UPI003D352153